MDQRPVLMGSQRVFPASDPDPYGDDTYVDDAASGNDTSSDPADSPIDPENRQGAQLTQAEYTMFRRIDSESDWILDHPDLEDESYGANHQTQFAPDSRLAA